MTTKITHLTSEAKEALRKTIRGLRDPLIEMLTDAAKSEYRLDLPIEKAKLPQARHCRRERLEACLDEEARSAARSDAATPKSAKAGKAGKTAKSTKPAKSSKGGEADGRARFFKQAVKESAHTLVNRLVMLRILEHHGLIAPAVVTGAWSSPAYEQEFVHYAGPLGEDDTRGMRSLLDVVYAELALELPGLFGPVGLTTFFPVTAAALRLVVDAVNDPALDSAWGDDTTLGWIYQYWNDPDREALDKKIAAGGKIEPHEIAQKTQMFTERYMVEWLLHNSLGLTWLSMCKKRGWTADAEAVLPVLDARRAEWRAKRDAGEVALDGLMPIADGLESTWKYYVPQPIPVDAIEKAPASIREVKLLDPACGSGHFLVIAFGLFVAMYEEEARHTGVVWSAKEIAESILANNLHGVDIDPRAIQIAAAGLWLKAKLHASDAKLSRMHLVAPAFRLAGLPKDDPALVRLFAELGKLGVAHAAAEAMVEGLSGVDYLGTLLRVDDAIHALVDETGKDAGELFAHAMGKQRVALESRVASLLEAHGSEADLGLRLEGEQLAAGLRFLEIVRQRRYDVVVGNPPYQGLPKTAQFEYVVKRYPRGRADLYAAFLERSLELTREGGVSALLTMRGWMFLGQFKELRSHFLKDRDIHLLGDVDRGAFEDVPDEVLATVMSVIRRSSSRASGSIAIQPTPLDDHSRDSARTDRKRAALLAQVGRHDFDPKAFVVIEGEPIVYWWTKTFLSLYASAPKLGAVSPARKGLCTGDDTRFHRLWWEVRPDDIFAVRLDACNATPRQQEDAVWVPTVKGGKDRVWIEPLTDLQSWRCRGLEVRLFDEQSGSTAIRNPGYYFAAGVAFSMVGQSFLARAHRFASVFGDKGASVFVDDVAGVTCLMNTSASRSVLESLNPTVNFQVGDVNRLPILPVADAPLVFARLNEAFTESEATRENSIEFRAPAVSCWKYAQEWAQAVIDRAPDAAFPDYKPQHVSPEPIAHVAFSFRRLLGNHSTTTHATADDTTRNAGTSGIAFIGPTDTFSDTLATSFAAPVLDAWSKHATAIVEGKTTSLRDWLRKDFFAYHKAIYDNRPIYFPLSSEKRSFVAWVSIHRWTDSTLRTLLADHLNPVLRQLDGEIADLNTARASSDKKTAVAADKQYNTVKRLRDELADFIALVSQCAERGAPSADPSDPRCSRAADAPFHMDLDDGVMINSAALWPLLAPQWSDPKKWWKQLCLAEGKKDYDWSHLARRYFPERVEEKCKTDPSLAVAHGCFWKYHPAKAYAWELRLQDEIRPDFTIDEADSDAARTAFLKSSPDEAAALHAKELLRRERKASKTADDDDDASRAAAESDESPEEADDA